MDFAKLKSLPQIRAAAWVIKIADTDRNSIFAQVFQGAIPSVIQQLFTEPRLVPAVYQMLANEQFIQGDDYAKACGEMERRYGYGQSGSVKLFMNAFIALTIYRRQLERGYNHDYAGNLAMIALQAAYGQAYNLYDGNKIMIPFDKVSGFAEAIDMVHDAVFPPPPVEQPAADNQPF